MIRRMKGLELMKIVFITNLSTFGSNMLILTLKSMDFENVALTKCVHGYVIKGIMYNINDKK
jgi:hypothetical protein